MTNPHIGLLCDVGELSAVLAGKADFGNFLERVVELVASYLNADISSIYLYDEQSETLRLEATRGLKHEAIGQVNLKPGEGLVGSAFEQAQPIMAAKACEHPSFCYISSTGENETDAFLAVPIQGGLRLRGIVTAQRRQGHPFDEQDAQTLSGVASQLSSALENLKALLAIHAPAPTEPTGAFRLIKGRAAAGGLASGRATIIKPRGSETLKAVIDLQSAVSQTAEQLDQLQQRLEAKLPEMVAMIFMAQLMMLKDPSFIGEVETLIAQGQDAAAAVRKVADHYATLFAVSPLPYIREKAHDVADLSARLINNLCQTGVAGDAEVGERIAVAGNLYPSEILTLAAEGVSGVIMVQGGLTAHVAILARSLDLPLVISEAPELLDLPAQARIILDGEVGNIYLNPSPDIEEKFNSQRQLRAQSLKLTPQPETFTKDGTRIRLMANINLLSEVALAYSLKADGIGLYRSEFPFLIRTSFPSENEQYKIYRRLFEDSPETEVTFRTLDVGGDKLLSYSEVDPGENPALGLRSIRFSLKHTKIFKQQLRAALRAAAGFKGLRIMFPLISSLEEFNAARALVDECLQELRARGQEHNANPKIGMMVELPAVVEIMPELSRAADFFCIGTNDFVQYMLGVDRTNAQMVDYYRPDHPAVLRALKRIAQVCIENGKDISVCGEMAHAPEFVKFFLGIGIRKLSLDPRRLYDTQRIIEDIDIASASAQAAQLLA